MSHRGRGGQRSKIFSTGNFKPKFSGMVDLDPLYILAGKYFDFGNGRLVAALLVKIKKKPKYLCMGSRYESDIDKDGRP